MLGIKRFIAGFLSSALTGRVVSSLFSQRIPCLKDAEIVLINSSSLKHSVKAQFFFGLYESGEMRFIKNFLHPGENVIEVGASIGVVSSFINKYKKPNKLLLVEANPNLIDILRANLALNTVTNYTLYNNAIGDGSVDVLEFMEGSDNTTGSLVTNNDNCSATIPVKVIALDHIIRENALDSYVLVADIEGAEVFILNDTRSLKKCKMMIMELHDTECDGGKVTVVEMKRRIENVGFDIIGEYGPLITAINRDCF